MSNGPVLPTSYDSDFESIAPNGQIQNISAIPEKIFKVTVSLVFPQKSNENVTELF